MVRADVAGEDEARRAVADGKPGWWGAHRVDATVLDDHIRSHEPRRVERRDDHRPRQGQVVHSGASSTSRTASSFGSIAAGSRAAARLAPAASFRPLPVTTWATPSLDPTTPDHLAC